MNNGSSTLHASARPISEKYLQLTDACPSCQTSNHPKSDHNCASCGLFHHLACASFKKEESSSICTWLCQTCLFPEHATLFSPQPSTEPSMNKHLLDERELPMVSPNCVNNVLKRISQLRRFYRIPIRIPVAEVIDRMITSALNIEWNNLVSFPILAFGLPINPNMQVPLSHPSSVQI